MKNPQDHSFDRGPSLLRLLPANIAYLACLLCERPLGNDCILVLVTCAHKTEQQGSIYVCTSLWRATKTMLDDDRS